jgi:cytoskeleton protein RodZ
LHLPEALGGSAVSRHRKRRSTLTDQDTRNPFVHGPRRGHPSQPRATAEVHGGEILKRAREAKGLALDDLIRTTKINRGILQALEASDFARLPAPIYTRGFVKAYAREVGLDPAQTANNYLSELEIATPSPLPMSLASSPSRAELMALDDDNANILLTHQARRLGGVVTVACAIGLVLYVWSFGRQREPSPPLVEAPAAATDAARAEAPPQAVPDAVTASPAPAETGGPLQIELRPAGLCWVAATADGTRVLARLLRSGDQHTISVNDELTLRVGDPGALTYSINGRAGRPLGRAGEPVSVRITRENFRQFIPES